MNYSCPVCAYRQLPEPPNNFSICPCCGTEFGLDDAKRSHAQLRTEWVASGAQWFSKARRSQPGWNPWLQLIEGGMILDLPYRARVETLRQPQGVERSIFETREPVLV